MALSSLKGVVISVPVLVLSVTGATVFLFFLLSSLSSSPPPCTCPTTGAPATTASGSGDDSAGQSYERKRISDTMEDIEWVKSQIESNGLHMADNVLRKGINPRTRQQQLQDLLQFKGISHYEGEDAKNHTALPCPGQLLVEEHHSNYGEPWAGGRDVFEFLAESAKITRDSRVLEIGCGTLRVGLHFIRAFSGHLHGQLLQSQHRGISYTAQLSASWMDKIKGVFTGNNTSPDATSTSAESFTLLRFADELSKARKVGAFKQYIVGRSSEATFSDAFEKQEAIIRCLGGFDPTGDNLLTSQKQEAAKKCNCTIADVENALAKFSWAKEAQRKIEKLKEEGKPMPKSLAEVQKLVGSTPMDVARSNLAKSGQISRNAPCPCGSKKLYKRCCGKDGKSLGETKI